MKMKKCIPNPGKGSHMLELTFSVSNILIFNKEKKKKPFSDYTNCLNTVSELYTSLNRKAIFCPFSFSFLRKSHYPRKSNSIIVSSIPV